MERVTRANLEAQLERTASAMGRTSKSWDENGDTVIGALMLDHSSYGGWDVVELVNAGRGEHSLFGSRRLDATSTLVALRGMEEAARIAAQAR